MNRTSLKYKFTLFLFATVLVCGILAMKPVQVEASSNYDRWMEICSDTLKDLKDHNFKYGNGGTKRTYSSALKSNKKANCALYVSWCMQKYGAAKSESVFWVKGNGKLVKRGSFTNVKLIKYYKKCKNIKLQPGDIVCWKGSAHVNIYAGKNSKGQKVWYDGGKVATKGNRTGSRYTHTGKRSLGYLNSRTVSYVIRINNL